MNGKINLCIVTNDMIYKIPFATIRQLDMFTVRYRNNAELIDSLIKILKIPVDLDEVIDINVQYVYTDTKLPIKYSGDNYDMSSVVSGYIYYLQNNQKRLDDYGIRNVVKIYEPDYKYKIFSNDYIRFLAKKYLKDDYRKIRDAYFLIKDKVRIKIDKVKSRIKQDRRMNVEETKDDYIEFLLGCLEKDEEHRIMAMEELAAMDLEVLEKKISFFNYGIIDGVGKDRYDQCDIDDIKELERFTGLNIDDLIYVVNYENGRKRKK